jgi:hypothetical protein
MEAGEGERGCDGAAAVDMGDGRGRRQRSPGIITMTTTLMIWIPLRACLVIPKTHGLDGIGKN